jgi:hypothetical protein
MPVAGGLLAAVLLLNGALWMALAWWKPRPVA